MNLEDITDLKSFHGIDAEAELIKILQEEIDKEIIEKLRKEYGNGGIYKPVFSKIKFKKFYETNYLINNGSTEISTDI